MNSKINIRQQQEKTTWLENIQRASFECMRDSSGTVRAKLGSLWMQHSG